MIIKITFTNGTTVRRECKTYDEANDLQARYLQSSKVWRVMITSG